MKINSSNPQKRLVSSFKFSKGSNTLFLSISLILSGQTFAQSVPDSGILLQQQPTVNAPEIPEQQNFILEPSAETAEEDNAPSLTVNGFTFTGNTLISEAELQVFIQEFKGQDLTFNQLENIALQLTGYYAEQGYLARTMLLPQDVKGGIIDFKVAEGIRGNVDLNVQGSRVNGERISRFISGYLPAGNVMNVSALGEALNLLNEQPGVDVSASLSPGEQEREIDLMVTAQDQQLLSYNFSTNNHGSRATGREQLSASITANNPFGHFDSISLLANKTTGNVFGRIDYSSSVGYKGLRLGTFVSVLDYRLTQDSLVALKAEGSAHEFGFNASYPLFRTSALNLSLTGDLTQRKLVDKTTFGESSNRIISKTSIGLSGYSFFPGEMQGVMTFGANVIVGDTDQRNTSAKAADAAARNTQGDFSKLALYGGLIIPISDTWTLRVDFRGQYGNKNLDSSEQFSLGGSTGIRGYPAAEATGDDGFITSISYNKRINDRINMGIFMDTGRIRLNHDESDPITNNNIYQLAGVGLNLDWQFTSKILFNAVYAAPINTNPAQTFTGKNNDGSDHGPQVWATLTAAF